MRLPCHRHRRDIPVPAYREYRRLQHQVRLQGAREARVEPGPQAARRAAVDSLWDSVFGGAWVVFNVISRIVFDIFGSIPALGPVLVFLWAIIQALVHLAFLVIMVIAMIKAFSGSRWDIPYVGPVARKYSGE